MSEDNGLVDSEDTATAQIDDESLADDASGMEAGADLDAAEQVSETPPEPPAQLAPAAPKPSQPAQPPAVTPAPASPPVASNPPPVAPPSDASPCRCGSGAPVGMRSPAGNGLFSMRIPASKELFGTRVPTSKGQCSDRRSGTLKWFNNVKCYGFITPEGGQGLFVHYRSIQGNGFKCLKEGQRVTFKVVQGQKGLQADEVQAL